MFKASLMKIAMAHAILFYRRHTYASVKDCRLSTSGATQAGPEDYSGRTPSGEPKGPGKRRSKIEHGESVKRGCQAHFTVRCYAVGVYATRACLDTISSAGAPYCSGAMIWCSRVPQASTLTTMAI